VRYKRITPKKSFQIILSRIVSVSSRIVQCAGNDLGLRGCLALAGELRRDSKVGEPHVTVRFCGQEDVKETSVRLLHQSRQSLLINLQDHSGISVSDFTHLVFC
jgi:hypothetical protein